MSNSVLINLIRKLDSFNCSDYYGLRNQGATCYLNSVLQVLFMTRDFREAVERYCGQDSSTIDPHLTRLFKDLERGTADTRHITKKLGIVQIYEERDAAEYFERILNMVTPEASQIFKGGLRHRSTCLGCGRQSDAEGSFWTLPLSMEAHRHHVNSVRHCFEAFFQPSEVTGDNKLYCDFCDAKTDATMECEIEQHPEVLTLLLKRFELDSLGKHYVKNSSCVDVPKTLQTTDGTYDLYALVNHYGSLAGGHVTATIKSYETGEWYNFNDARVTLVKPSLFEASNNKTKSSNVYLLMYRKGSKMTNGDAQEPHSEKPDEEDVDEEDVDEEDVDEEDVDEEDVDEEDVDEEDVDEEGVAESGEDRITSYRHPLKDGGDYATKSPKRIFNQSKKRRDDMAARDRCRGETVKERRDDMEVRDRRRGETIKERRDDMEARDRCRGETIKERRDDMEARDGRGGETIKERRDDMETRDRCRGETIKERRDDMEARDRCRGETIKERRGDMEARDRCRGETIKERRDNMETRDGHRGETIKRDRVARPPPPLGDEVVERARRREETLLLHGDGMTAPVRSSERHHYATGDDLPITVEKITRRSDTSGVSGAGWNDEVETGRQRQRHDRDVRHLHRPQSAGMRRQRHHSRDDGVSKRDPSSQAKTGESTTTAARERRREDVDAESGETDSAVRRSAIRMTAATDGDTEEPAGNRVGKKREGVTGPSVMERPGGRRGLAGGRRQPRDVDAEDGSVTEAPRWSADTRNPRNIPSAKPKCFERDERHVGTRRRRGEGKSAEQARVKDVRPAWK